MQKRWAGIARLGGIGDNLMAASVARPMKRLGYQVDMLTAAGNHVVYWNNPFIDKLSVKEPGDLPEGDIGAWQRWFTSRAKEYDLFAHLSHSCEARHAFFQHMTQFWWSEDYRRELCAGSYIETVHDIAGVPYEFGPLFFPTDEEKERAADTKAKIGPKTVGWILGGSRIDKIYPYSAMIIGRIIKELGLPVIMFGAYGMQFQMAKSIMEHVERQNGTFEGLGLALTPDGAEAGGDMNWPIRRILTQCQACDVVITPDTGPAWAVAFEDVPKVLMVSHASVENISKHWKNTVVLHADENKVPCWPCHRLHDTPETCVQNKDGNGAACISDISVELILTSVRAALREEDAVKTLIAKYSTQVHFEGFAP